MSRQQSPSVLAAAASPGSDYLQGLQDIVHTYILSLQRYAVTTAICVAWHRVLSAAIVILLRAQESQDSQAVAAVAAAVPGSWSAGAVQALCAILSVAGHKLAVTTAAYAF